MTHATLILIGSSCSQREPNPNLLSSTAGAAPKLLSDLGDETVVSPADATLECRINRGQPEADIKWFRDNKEIYKNKKYAMTSEGERVGLVVSGAEPLDSGMYRCEASNKLGAVKTQCTLTVQSMYSFTLQNTPCDTL